MLKLRYADLGIERDSCFMWVQRRKGVGGPCSEMG